MRKLLLILGLAFFSNIQAADLTIPNTFTAGTPAVADDVNANFTAAKVAVDDNNTNIVNNTGDIDLNAINIGINQSAILDHEGRISVLEAAPPSGLPSILFGRILADGSIATFNGSAGSLVVNRTAPGRYQLDLPGVLVLTGTGCGPGPDGTFNLLLTPLNTGAVNDVIAFQNGVGSRCTDLAQLFFVETNIGGTEADTGFTFMFVR